MIPNQVKRKLTTILSADVRGYSRLMEVNEEGTIQTLKAYLGAISGFIQQHQGRVFSTGGDSVLAEFSSVVDAVRCAVAIQEDLKERNKDLPENRRMEFRIGVNLGDVVEEADTLLGDGVNIASRIQSLAEGGGICISGTVFEHVEKKLSLSYKYLGEQKVKNIEKPIRVYQILMKPEAKRSKNSLMIRVEGKRVLALGVIITLIVIALGITLYQFVLRPSSAKIEVAPKEKMAFPLPDNPSIAVLPFVNMSGDPKQEFFSDGITEDVITALSRIPKLFVIARNSTFTYKGKPVKVKQVSEDLGVRYVLEGSVQRSGERVRITAQLIDALSGHHLWSERYDREMKNLFALQDEVTLRILTALQVKLTEGEQASLGDTFISRKHGLECYLKIWEANYYFLQLSPEGSNKCRRIAEEIVSKWPAEPWGYTFLGLAHWHDVWFNTTKSQQESIGKAMEMVKKALALDNSLYRAHSLLGVLYCAVQEHDKGIIEGKRGMDLMPNGAQAIESYAIILCYSGLYKEAIPFFNKSIRLNPFGSVQGYLFLGNCYLFPSDKFEEAILAYKHALKLNPDNQIAHSNLATAYIAMGREKEARAEAAEVLRINPNFSLKHWERAGSVFKDKSGINKYISRLSKAGLK